MVLDSHAHLTSKEMLSDVDSVVERAVAAGVEQVVNICTDASSLEAGIELSKRWPGVVFNTAATTPHDVEADGEAFFPLVERSVGELVAIGETGLDYFYEHSPKGMQQTFLQRYLELAERADLPVVFHCREAFSDLFSLVERDQCLLHCFTGTLEEAKGVLDRGWYLSLSGIVTYKKSEELRKVAKFVPLDRLMVETDSPFLAPQNRRGKRNEPAFVAETIEMIARVKGVENAVVELATAENARQFFSLREGS